MSKFKERLAELQAKIKNLDEINVDVQTKEDFIKFYNEYWPQIKDVLEFVKDRKITRKRADKKLQDVINAGDQVYATLNDPAKLEAALNNFQINIDGNSGRFIQKALAHEPPSNRFATLHEIGYLESQETKDGHRPDWCCSGGGCFREPRIKN